MNIQFRWKNCDRSKAVESGIINIANCLEKYPYINKNLKIEIVYYKKNNIFKTRINAFVVGKNNIRAESSDSSIYGAIKDSIDKIKDQLRCIKTKYQNKH